MKGGRVGTWPFHAGELEAQGRAGGGSAGAGIVDAMSDQHRDFFAALPFVVVATLDGGGPVATLLAGTPGFVSAPDERSLLVRAALDPGDPAAAALKPGAAAGVLGIDLATRRRNRENGMVAAAAADGFVLDVRQSFGNCPQYIHLRDVAAAPARREPLEPLARLDAEARAAISSADTFFVASSARTDEPAGGVDISHRGGPAGFVRAEGDVLTIPDYRGNRYFNTLGNLVSDPRAALLFVDFERGDLLHLQGSAQIVWDGPEVATFPAAQRLWRVRVEGGWRRRGAVPLRWSPATSPFPTTGRSAPPEGRR
jgi:uncharacterized protein